MAFAPNSVLASAHRPHGVTSIPARRFAAFTSSRCGGATRRLDAVAALPSHASPPSAQAITTEAFTVLPIPRRIALTAAGATLWALCLSAPPTARAEAGASPSLLVAPPSAAIAPAGQTATPAAAAVPTAEYSSPTHSYRLRIPAAWEQKDKAGADVLFEDPAARSTSLGVTVSQVRVRSIQDFGSLEDVGNKLLEVERQKESTLSVDLLHQASHQDEGGALMYDYEYELDTTRGRKRIFNTVTIQDAKLYILNGMSKCTAKGGCDMPTLQLLRDSASSLAIMK